MRVIVFQHETIWEDPLANHFCIEKELERYFEDNTSEVGIVVLPEFFATGFTMNQKFAQSVDGHTVSFMKGLSGRFGFAVVGSVAVMDGGTVYNRAYFVTPSGEMFHYDKRHLFRMSSENEVYSSGEQKCVFEYKGWRIALNVCYDLRFPVWSRNVNNEYDLMINVANWPVQRIAAAHILSKARAIENQSYFIFANRAGESPYEKYSGDSLIVDFKGNDIADRDNGKFIAASLDLESLRTFRKKFPAWMDADSFILDK